MKSTAEHAVVTTIAIDLAKEVFQLALADSSFRTVRKLRLKRADFFAFWPNHPQVHVVMEACGSAHHVGRWLSAMGHRVSLLPPQYVRPYVRRNKTDAADCAALLEALRAGDIHPVPIKSEHQQLMQLMHRTRTQWQKDRTRRAFRRYGQTQEAPTPRHLAPIGGRGRRSTRLQQSRRRVGQHDPQGCGKCRDVQEHVRPTHRDVGSAVTCRSTCGSSHASSGRRGSTIACSTPTTRWACVSRPPERNPQPLYQTKHNPTQRGKSPERSQSKS